jgi:hypothetical protein
VTKTVTTPSGATEKVTLDEPDKSSKTIEVPTVVNGLTTIVTEKVPDTVHTESKTITIITPSGGTKSESIEVAT